MVQAPTTALASAPPGCSELRVTAAGENDYTTKVPVTPAF